MEKLGIEPVALLTQVFNFLLMVFILSKLLYKPVTKMLDERRKKIAQGLEYEEKMKQEFEKSDKRREEILEEARTQAKGIIGEAKVNGKKVEEEIIADAHKEAEGMIAKAKGEIELEHEEMEKSLRKEAVEIASAMVQKILEENLSASEQKLIIDEKLKSLEHLKKS